MMTNGSNCNGINIFKSNTQHKFIFTRIVLLLPTLISRTPTPLLQPKQNKNKQLSDSILKY